MTKLKASAIALALTLAACGGGNNGGNAPASETLQFTGSFINGARYVSGARTGITGVDCKAVKPGCFDALSAGDKVTFSLGSIALPEITTTPGQTQIETIDIARALDPATTSTSPAYLAVYAVLDALNTGSEPMEGQERVFQVMPAVAGAAPQLLSTIIDNKTTEADLLTAIAMAASNSSGLSIDPKSIDTTAAEKSSFAIAAQGFTGEGSIRPNPELKPDFGNASKLDFTTSDLLGLWSADNADGFNGLIYKDDGTLQLANTLAGSPNTSSFISRPLNWNVVEGVFVSTSEFGERQCIVTERTSATKFKLACVDFDNIGNSDSSFVANYNKVELGSVLSAGDGKWNFAFEERFNETGTITFASAGTYVDSVTSTDDCATNCTDSVNGDFEVSELFLGLEDKSSEGGDSSSCAFAGAKQNTAGEIEDIFLRCSGSDEDPDEDVVLTKRATPAALANTNMTWTATPIETVPL